MPEPDRFAADTNIIVSRLLFRHSLPAQALRHAMSRYRLIVSAETLIELGTVLSRPKFDRYLTLSDRLGFFELLRRQAIHIRTIPPITACRDRKDDKYLALAVAGRAKYILTGDDDLLTLNPFRSIQIVSPREYFHREQPANI